MAHGTDSDARPRFGQPSKHVRRQGSADNIREDSMKYVIAWEDRENTSEELLARGLQVFSKWSPAEGANFLQFVGRVDARGGFAVVETDDVALIARDMAIFTAFFDMSVYPVLDVQETARIGGEAIKFRNGAS
jgi:hypothetical protein